MIRSCGFLIYREQQKREFLLMEHAKRWDLPKGHVDAGETDLECALRELHEETGIPKRKIEIDDSFRFTLHYQVTKRTGKLADKELVVFLAELTKEHEIVVTEHLGYSWLRWQPPHKIQKATIDPLLAVLEKHWRD